VILNSKLFGITVIGIIKNIPKQLSDPGLFSHIKGPEDIVICDVYEAPLTPHSWLAPALIVQAFVGTAPSLGEGGRRTGFK